MAKQQSPEKYESIDGTIQPCSEDVRRQHLESFATSFIREERAARWIHATVEKPKKARDYLHKFPNYLIPSRCQKISNRESWPKALTEQFGNKEGFYFNHRGECGLTTVGHAASICCGVDTIFSIIPGKLAIFFFHEDETWVCKK